MCVIYPVVALVLAIDNLAGAMYRPAMNHTL